MTQRLILASASPRRSELLSRAGLAFEVIAADVDESPLDGETPEAYVVRVAHAKADQVARAHPEALVLAADTTVVLEGRILGKPASVDEALATLEALGGRTHRVLSAVALSGRARAAHVETTHVTMRRAPRAELAWYVATGEPMDKAGAYAIQGIGAQLVSRIEGSHSNVIGLPLAETLALLERLGHPLPWSPTCPT